MFELPVPIPEEITTERTDEHIAQIDEQTVEEDIVEEDENNGDDTAIQNDFSYEVLPDSNEQGTNNGESEGERDEIENENSENAPQFEFVKVESAGSQPVYAINNAQHGEVYNLLEEAEVIQLGDGEEMIIGEKGIPDPMHSTTDGLVKREKDAVSGNKPFKETVSYSINILF